MANKDRRIVVKPVPRDDIDLKRLARLIVELALERRAAAQAVDIEQGKGEGDGQADAA